MSADAATTGVSDPTRSGLGAGVAVLVAAAVLALGGDVGAVIAGTADDALLADPTGPALAVLLVAGWLAAGGPYAFLIGQVGLVVGLDGGPSATPAAQAALVALLVVDVAQTGTDRDRAWTAVVALGTGFALFAVLDAIEGTAAAGLAVLLLTAVAAYTIHRYELLTLGLVGDPE